jgi:YegS/Rv2252/BmrU family lipid kinase
VLDTSTGVLVMVALAILILLTVGAIAVFSGDPPDKTSTHDAGERRRSTRARPPGAYRQRAETQAVEGAQPLKRAAVVVNPTKFDDVRATRRHVATVFTQAGWDEPLWLETTKEDPGFGQGQQALDAGVDLVCSLGGDGTTRSVASALVGSSTPLGLLPGGTGNLLARNLGVPFDELDKALRAAMGGTDLRVDVGRLTVNPSGEHQRLEEHVFLVMAGVGFDADIMADAPEQLKARVGWLAYGVSGVKHLKGAQFTARVRVDDKPEFTRRARTILIGNCGKLTGGLVLLPQAKVNDGWLDSVILSPEGLPGWVAVALRVIARRPRGHERVDHHRIKEIAVRTNGPEEVQLDGDTIGRARAISAKIEPRALTVRVPPEVLGASATR